MTTEQTPSAEEGQEMRLRASETVFKVTDLQVAVMRQKTQQQRQKRRRLLGRRV